LVNLTYKQQILDMCASIHKRKHIECLTFNYNIKQRLLYCCVHYHLLLVLEF